VEECLSSNHEALISNLSMTKTGKRKTIISYLSFNFLKKICFSKNQVCLLRASKGHFPLSPAQFKAEPFLPSCSPILLKENLRDNKEDIAFFASLR
jgi:hypothetical protein